MTRSSDFFFLVKGLEFYQPFLATLPTFSSGLKRKQGKRTLRWTVFFSNSHEGIVCVLWNAYRLLTSLLLDTCSHCWPTLQDLRSSWYSLASANFREVPAKLLLWKEQPAWFLAAQCWSPVVPGEACAGASPPTLISLEAVETLLVVLKWLPLSLCPWTKSEGGTFLGG